MVHLVDLGLTNLDGPDWDALPPGFLDTAWEWMLPLPGRRPRRLWMPAYGMMEVMVATWITPKAVKGTESAIAGRGLVAHEQIAEGEVVAVKGGHVVTTDDLRTMPERLQNSEVQIADNLHLVAVSEDEYEPVMLFLNHSCEPNIGFGGNTLLVAMRGIEPGEELTTDYALFDDYEGAMDCKCGRASCRGRIDGRDWQRPDLQARYRGYFSWYLDRRIRRLSTS